MIVLGMRAETPESRVRNDIEADKADCKSCTVTRHMDDTRQAGYSARSCAATCRRVSNDSSAGEESRTRRDGRPKAELLVSERAAMNEAGWRGMQDRRTPNDLRNRHIDMAMPWPKFTCPTFVL